MYPLRTSLGCYEVRRGGDGYGEIHATHLEGDATRLVDGLLDAVAGHVALQQLVLAHLADLEHEAPLAVNATDHGLVGADDGAASCLEVRELRGSNDGSTQTRIDDADAERVHKDGLHHFAVKEKEGNGMVAYASTQPRTRTKVNIRDRVTNCRNGLQTDNHGCNKR